MILKTPHGNVAIAQRDASLGATLRAEGLLRDSSTVGVNPRTVAGLPAWKQAIRIAAEGIAKHRMRVWRGEEAQKRRVTGTWQARFFAGQPNERYSWFYAWECTEALLTSRSNAYWWKWFDPLGRVDEIYVVHPDSVVPRWNPELKRPEYSVLLEDGMRSPWFGPDVILHFRIGFSSPTSLIAPSPIEEHRKVWEAALAKQEAESGFYKTGSMKTTAVVFPGDVTPDQAKAFKEVYLGPGGVTDSSQVKVFGGDPRLETIGLSLQDQQFVETQAFSIDDVGRILGVMPSLLWAASAATSKPITPEHEEDRWFRYGLSPRRMRIEETIKHDGDFFGRDARDYPGFDAAEIAGDLLTEDAIAHQQIQDGRLLVDEWREPRGLPPLPDGLGKIPQIVPVGGAPNPVTQAPADPAAD